MAGWLLGSLTGLGELGDPGVSWAPISSEAQVPFQASSLLAEFNFSDWKTEALRHGPLHYVAICFFKANRRVSLLLQISLRRKHLPF